MGIPGLFGGWIMQLQERIQELFANEDELPRDNVSLYIDANAMLHGVLGTVSERTQVTAREDFEQGLSEKLIELVTTIYPDTVLMIAIDGVAPLAKIQQQRRRRFNTFRDLKEEYQRTHRRGVEVDMIKPYSGLSLSPGTEMMWNTHQYFKSIMAWRENDALAKVLPSQTVYSSYLTPGEGEHKIFNYIRERSLIDKEFKDGMHVIHGADADLILLALICPVDNIIIFREERDMRTGSVKANYIVIDIIRQEIYKSMGGVEKESGYHLYNTQEIIDFVALMSIVGNDFLPKIHSLASVPDAVNIILSTYKKIIEGDAEFAIVGEDGKVNISEVQFFIQNILQTAPEDVLLDSMIGSRFPSDIIIRNTRKNRVFMKGFITDWYTNEATNMFDEIKQIPRESFDERDRSRQQEDVEEKERNIKSRTKFLKRLEKIKGYLGENNLPFDSGDESDEGLISMMTMHYLSTLRWVFAYYSGDREVDIDYYYPFLHAPTLNDLAVDVKKYVGDISELTDRSQLTVIHQLVAIMPVSNYLPQEFEELWSTRSTIVDYYPTYFVAESYGTNPKEGGIPQLPLVDKRRIKQAVGCINYSGTFLERYIPETMSIIENTIPEETRFIEREVSRNLKLDIQKRKQVESLTETIERRSDTSHRGGEARETRRYEGSGRGGSGRGGSSRGGSGSTRYEERRGGYEQRGRGRGRKPPNEEYRGSERRDEYRSGGRGRGYRRGGVRVSDILREQNRGFEPVKRR